MTYDITKQSSVIEKISDWAPAAIELTQNLINRAIKVTFEHVKLSEGLPKKPHNFGRLMIQRNDGQMVTVVKCLLDMNMAVLADDFQKSIQFLETLRPTIWTSATGEVLDTKLVVAPRLTVCESTGYTDKEYFDDETVIDDDGLDDTLYSAEDNAFFDESASMMGPKGPMKQNGAVVTEAQQIAAALPKPTQNVSNGGSTAEKTKNEQRQDNSGRRSAISSHTSSKSAFENSRPHADAQGKQIAHIQNGRALNADVQKDQQRANNQRKLQNQVPKPQVNQAPHPQSVAQNQANSQRGKNRNDQQRNARGKKGYVPPHMRPQQNHHRNNSKFGDPEFAASFPRPQKLEAIPESVATNSQHEPKNELKNGPMHFQPPKYVQRPSNGYNMNFAPPPLQINHMNRPPYPTYGMMNFEQMKGLMNHPPPNMGRMNHRPPFLFNHPPEYGNRGPPKNDRFNHYKKRNDKPTYQNRQTNNGKGDKSTKEIENKVDEVKIEPTIERIEQIETKPDAGLKKEEKDEPAENAVAPTDSAIKTEPPQDNSE